MDINSAIEQYLKLGRYNEPDYNRENSVLTEFKKEYPKLSEEQAKDLIDILQSDKAITYKYFVADLLYLYSDFDEELIVPLIITGINHRDPSSNRVFLRPCLRIYGDKKIADLLLNLFNQDNIVQRIGIASLLYWFRPQKMEDREALDETILTRAKETTNLVERYYYKLIYSKKIKKSYKIPDNAAELKIAIKGNIEYEELLYNKLGWK